MWVRFDLRLSLAAIALCTLCALGCTHSPRPTLQPPKNPIDQDTAAATDTATPADAESTKEEKPKRISLRQLCREEPPTMETEPGKPPALDAMRQRIAETFCGATLWLDGMFGDEPDLENARAVSGRVKLFSVHSEFEGTDVKVRLRIKYDLPNLERRLNLFLGREDEMEFVEDRRESFTVRSAVFDLDNDERWLAGLGYSPPGKWRQRFDVRVGGRLSSSPEIFVQGRMRHNIFRGDSMVWRFRQTVFWENRDGFGLTSKAEIDRILRTNLLGRWSTVATISEATDGFAWRSSGLLYYNLNAKYATAQEIFVRGATNNQVPLREYGIRNVIRRSLNRHWLFGELVVGYTWPKERLGQEREGSALVGIGIELHFGDSPY